MRKPVHPGQKRLPLFIRDAADAARHIPGLPRGVKATLAAIVSFVDKNDPEAIVFARKEKIAERADCTDRTIRNHLRKLEDEGLIVSHEQGHRKDDGKFKVTHLQLTEKLKAIIGMEPVDNSPPQEKFSEPMAEISAAPNKGFLSDPSCISQIDNAPKLRAAVVPQELGYLTQRMHIWGVFSLMKKAKQNGKLLSDVAICAQARVEKLDLRGARLYAYLSALIVAAVCFAFPAKQAKAAECEQQAKTTQLKRIESARSRWKGKEFIAFNKHTGKAMSLFQFAEDGNFVQIFDLESRRFVGTQPLFTAEQACKITDMIDRGQLIQSTTV